MYITQLGLSYLNYEETVRHNKATEAETERANVAKEQETIRSNLVKEAETERHNREEEKAKLRTYQEDYRQFNLSYQLNKLRTYLEHADKASSILASDALLLDFLAKEGIPNPFAEQPDDPTKVQIDPDSAAKKIAQTTKQWGDKLWGAIKTVFGKKEVKTTIDTNSHGKEVVISEKEANIWDLLQTSFDLTQNTIDRALDYVETRDREIPGVWDKSTSIAKAIIEATAEGEWQSANGWWKKLMALSQIGVTYTLSPIVVLGCFGKLVQQWELDYKNSSLQRVKTSTKDNENDTLSPVKPMN